MPSIAASSSDGPFTIDVVSDVVCPWCYIGKRRLERALELLAMEGARVVPWLRPVEFKARWVGKVVTVFQLLTLAAVMVAPRYEVPLLVIVAVLSAWSIADYTLALWRGRAR